MGIGHKIASCCRPSRRLLRRFIFTVACLPYLTITLIILTAVFHPSYTRRPDHYQRLSRLCASSSVPGRANVNNEKVFLAASIYDEEGTLAGGAWGRAVLDLVDLLGPDNVFLSIYENDADPRAKASLDTFAEKVTCKDH